MLGTGRSRAVSGHRAADAGRAALAQTVGAAIVLGLVGCGPAEGPAAASLPAAIGVYRDESVSGVLASDGRFGVLLALLERASVYQGPPGAEVLLGTAADAADENGWDHTIFAPTDEAFARLARATADCIFDGSTATDSIRLIVVPRILESGAFETGVVQTIGDSIPMRVADARTSFGGARVIETDIHAANGVIHVIDEVIVPPQCTG